MKLVIVISIAVASSLFGFEEKIFACSCALPVRDMSLRQQVKLAKKKADAVFSGEVLSVKADGFYQTVKVRIISKWKGIKASEVNIYTGQGKGDCGYNFEVGKSYLIYAYKSSNGQLSTNICQRTNLLSEAGKDVDILK